MSTPPLPPRASRLTPRPGEGGDPEYRADQLKERIYVTFTSLAVVLALRTHLEGVTAGQAALTLFVTVVATLLAVFVADFTSHLSVHGVMPTRVEFGHMLGTSLGAIGVVVVPLLLLLAAGLGWIALHAALTAIVVILIVTLALVGYLAVRRARMPVRLKVLVLLVEVALGFAVVGLELIAHG
jgi:hypothetical protein